MTRYLKDKVIFKWKKHPYNVIMYKNTKEVIIKLKQTKKVTIIKDQSGYQTTNFKKKWPMFSRCASVT